MIENSDFDAQPPIALKVNQLEQFQSSCIPVLGGARLSRVHTEGAESEQA